MFSFSHSSDEEQLHFVSLLYKTHLLLSSFLNLMGGGGGFPSVMGVHYFSYDFLWIVRHFSQMKVDACHHLLYLKQTPL